jgi:predicted nucleic acid-binding protein
MADRYTLDASVAAKWFNNEHLTNVAIQVRDAHVQGRIWLVAPGQLLYEVGNSIWKNKALTPNDAAIAVRSLLDLKLEIVHLTPQIASEAMGQARKNSITFYDAAYIVLANHLDAPLISADSAMLSKSKKGIRLEDFHI